MCYILTQQMILSAIKKSKCSAGSPEYLSSVSILSKNELYKRIYSEPKWKSINMHMMHSEGTKV
jgi:hypothetical protein